MKLRPFRPTYTSCENLPLWNFIQIVSTAELKHLFSESARYIHRSPDLKSIWAEIEEEYYSLTNNTQHKYVFGLVKDITILNNRICIVNDVVQLLLKVENISDYAKSIDILNEYGCGHITPTLTNENRLEVLKRCVNICKRYLLELKQKETEYTNINNDEGKKVTVQDFYDSIASMSKFLGFSIPLHDTTVSTYISYINLMKANIEANGK